MAQETGAFVSVSKIDGKPILPPVIDDERRIEINRDRMLAMEIERRLKLQIPKNMHIDMGHGDVSDIDETLVKETIDGSISNYDTSAAVESLLDDNVSTLKEKENIDENTDENTDEKTNEKEIERKEEKEIEEEKYERSDRDYENMHTPEKYEDKKVDAKSFDIPHLSLSILSISSVNEDENLSPSFSLHSSPSLGALDESRNQSLYFTPMSGRESFSPRPKMDGQPSPRLIRSNSYVLEKPSPLLLKHMEVNGIPISSTGTPTKSPMSLNEFRRNQSTPSNIPRKSLGGNIGNSKQIKQNLTVPPNRFSLGGSKQSLLSTNATLNSAIVPPSRNQGQSIATKKTKALLDRQREEQKRMQEEFSRQQEELVKMIAAIAAKSDKPTPNVPVVSNVAKKSNEKMLIEEVQSDVSINYDANGNRINRFTPPENSKCIRRLCYDENKAMNSEMNDDKSSLSSLSTFTINSEHSDTYSAEELEAAIQAVIQAYARGYLTRRLFKTARVKEIKKTHYDTLALLLDICEEKNANESKSDVEFKFHLLQQLAKVCADFHEIFIEMAIAERMNIIAKDREWQQLKLNRSKSWDSNKTNSNHMIVNGNSHLPRSQSARFEKKF